MFVRERPPENPVTLTLDGKRIVAERGEPLAVALLAGGIERVARSPKLHRPRGPSCLRGDCEGCIARVDGVPNVMTCMRAAKGGEEISVQNVLGSKDTDLLRITDWFFPKGIDHHHLLAGIPGVSDVMQSFARRMAGIGRLPTEREAIKPATRAETDVIVVGGGLAGASVASSAKKNGLSVSLVDEGLARGGSARAAGAKAFKAWSALDLGGVTLRDRASAVGIYGNEVVVVTAEGATVVRAKAIVLATGAHDGAIAVPNNDLPGVMSARAICVLAAYGVFPKGRVALIGDGFWAKRAKAALGDRVAIELASSKLASIRGRSRVKGVTDVEDRSTDVDVVAVAGPGAPSFELAEAAGGKVELRRGGYAVVTDADGRVCPGVWATGECTGAPFSVEGLRSDGEKLGERIAKSLAAR